MIEEANVRENTWIIHLKLIYRHSVAGTEFTISQLLAAWTAPVYFNKTDLTTIPSTIFYLTFTWVIRNPYHIMSKVLKKQSLPAR